jgi:hypothetical protein
MLGTLKKFSVLVLAHLLLTPFFDVAHSFTSVLIMHFSVLVLAHLLLTPFFDVAHSFTSVLIMHYIAF